MRQGHFRLNRLLSEPLTQFLLKTPFTPNHVTVLSMLFGIGAGFLFATGERVPSLLAVFCYQIAIVLDNCDGEIARAKSLGSPFGAWFDIFADFTTDLSLFLGIALGALRQGKEGPVLLFAALCLTGEVLHLAIVIMEKLRGFGPAVYEKPNPEVVRRKNVIFNFFDALREGESSWFVVLFVLAGKSIWLLWFGGVYMQFLWMGALFLNFRYLFWKKAPQ